LIKNPGLKYVVTPGLCTAFKAIFKYSYWKGRVYEVVEDKILSMHN
jgi:hypothetical protein